MAVLGVGGLFVRSKDPEASMAWYRDVLGLQLDQYGGITFSHGEAAARYGDGARTIFARFKDDTDYFRPSAQPFMINLLVDDLDALLERIKAHGVELIGEPESYDYGRFAWIMDPDGVKIELWESVEL
ncbi:MAG TPA: glyoxalase [Oceanicaulis sp.]|jgi:predicted enzyme related to lactoylglutathione lyase|uniref:Glyoxalase n=1 Tax=Glycocaulis albus TaxID=1382801 RepID=A0ABQ1XN31_9PROT|nr:VOC family protein [Glycocaulis albus]GGG98312.1 glyoxalase [Glycocaulis albus]HCY55847.1 glyoxalase [Oceanicaulis sp.]